MFLRFSLVFSKRPRKRRTGFKTSSKRKRDRGRDTHPRPRPRLNSQPQGPLRWFQTGVFPDLDLSVRICPFLSFLFRSIRKGGSFFTAWDCETRGLETGNPPCMGKECIVLWRDLCWGAGWWVLGRVRVAGYENPGFRNRQQLGTGEAFLLTVGAFLLTVKLLCLQSLKAHNLRHFPTVSRKAPAVSKEAKTVSKKAPTVSKKAKIVNCK